jgi:hypothetical protein
MFKRHRYENMDLIQSEIVNIVFRMVLRDSIRGITKPDVRYVRECIPISCPHSSLNYNETM